MALHRMASFLQQIQAKVERRISKRVLKPFAFLFAGANLLMVLGVGIVTFEYQTNWFAKGVGGVLADTNARRRTVGGIWQRLRARAEVQETLDEGATVVSLPEGRDGLPPAVSDGRFQMERVPEAGMPGFVAVWRTSVGSGQREMPEVVESLRIFQVGLALLEAAALPDVRYRGRVRQEIAALYQQVGDVGEIEPAVGDSTVQISADSVRAAVVAELAREITDRLRREEQAALLEDYRAGRVGQILLQRGLGLYRGEVSFRDPETPKISFEVEPGRVARIFRLGLSDTDL